MSTGWFWKAASYSFIDDPPRFRTVPRCPDFVVSNVTRTLAARLRHRTRTRAPGHLGEVLGPEQHTLDDKPNYTELRQSEVRRITLPRTRVSQRLGPSFSNVLPIEFMAPPSTDTDASALRLYLKDPESSPS